LDRSPARLAITASAAVRPTLAAVVLSAAL